MDIGVNRNKKTGNIYLKTRASLEVFEERLRGVNEKKKVDKGVKVKWDTANQCLYLVHILEDERCICCRKSDSYCR
jgi:hypothetical protein